MRKDITFGQNQTMVVTNETIKGIAIDFGAVVAAGTVAALNDFNEVAIDMSIKRYGEKEQDIFRGYLDDLLTALYAQNPSYELNKTAFGKTYKVKVDFLGGVLKLQDGDEFKVTLRVPTTTFTNLDTSKSDTYCNLETIPAVGFGTPIPMVKSYGIGSGEINIDKQLGNGIHKIVAALDFTAVYTSSTKAKVQSLEILADNYDRAVSKEVLELENIHMFDNNPESDVAQMVLFWESQAINNVRLRCKLDKAADGLARLLVVHFFFP